MLIENIDIGDVIETWDSCLGIVSKICNDTITFYDSNFEYVCSSADVSRRWEETKQSRLP